MTLTDLVATYAALIATAALALEVRRWFDARPKVSVSVDAPWRLLQLPDRKYLYATVTNRWDKPFTIDHFAVFEFETIYHRVVLRKNCWNALVMSPNPEKPLPYRLEPGEIWTGFSDFSDDLEQRIRSRKLFFGVRCSFRNRWVLKRVRETKLMRTLGTNKLPSET